MHPDPEQLARAIRHIAEAFGIRSDAGKLLFGIECIVAFVLLVVVALFLLHDLIIAVLLRQHGESIAALQWFLAVMAISLVCVVIREYLTRPDDDHNS